MFTLSEEVKKEKEKKKEKQYAYKRIDLINKREVFSSFSKIQGHLQSAATVAYLAHGPLEGWT